MIMCGSSIAHTFAQTLSTSLIIISINNAYSHYFSLIHSHYLWFHTFNPLIYHLSHYY